MRAVFFPAINILQRLSLLAIGLVLTACTTVGPDYEAPEQPVLPSQWNAEQAAQDTREVTDWWTLFEDPVLNDRHRRRIIK